MNQLMGQSGGSEPVRSGDADLAPSSSAVRSTAAQGAEQAFFQLDVKRSLQLHWRLARTVALAFAALAVFYLLAQVFLFKSWPAYVAESTVYVQPTPPRVLPSAGMSPRWPYDSNTYESYIQQQMMNVSREDVLIAAVHKIGSFQRPGESDQVAAQRLVRTLEVTRAGDAYEFTISARAGNPGLAALIANSVTAAYMESASRDEQTGDAQRLSMLKEEKDRIQSALADDRTEQDALNRQLGVAAAGSTLPDHYDEDIAQLHSELVKARTDHDAAEAKFAALDAGHGATSAAIDAQADEIIASDAGLVSMKTALNARRATLISQMANLTPLNPQYKQDEVELTKINGTLDAMMKDLRAKAAARIQLQLRADLQRTGGVESQLNGQLRQLVGDAGSAAPKLQRSGDLAADITRLLARFAAVDEQLHNIMLEDSAPAAAYQVTPAVPPLSRSKSGVMRNGLLIAFAGLFFAVLAAVGAHKLDPRVYIASDVEQVLGFAPLAQLPDFRDVSEGVAEEYLLRLASTIEHARKQGNLRNCIFTGTGQGTGVSTLVNRVRNLLEAMGRPTVLVDATGAPRPGANGESAVQGLVPAGRVGRSTELLQQVAGEPETDEDSLVLTDTAPLAVSAETEYLARYVDCAIVVIESGVTTRAQLRATAATLERLKVSAVAFVLNRVGLQKADPAFRQSVEAVEKHQKALSANASRRTERSTAPPEETNGKDRVPRQASVRSLIEPEAAAAAAAVARFAPPTAAKVETAPAVCQSSLVVSAPGPEAARRFTVPLVAESAVPVAPAVSTPEPAKTAAKPLVAVAGSEGEKTLSLPIERGRAATLPHAAASAPFAEAAKHFSSLAARGPDLPFAPRPVALTAAPEPSSVIAKEPAVPTVATPVPPIEPVPGEAVEPAAELQSAPPRTDAKADMPWWLSEASRSPEPARPPVLWQPAKVWKAEAPSVTTVPLTDAASPRPDNQDSGTNAQQTWKDAPAATQPKIAFEKVTSSAVEEAPANLHSRLSGLRNLLFVLGVKNTHGEQESSDQQAPSNQPGAMHGATPRQVTAQPEFLPPRPVVIEFDNTDSHVGESSTRQDRRTPFDRVEILPSKRGQYKKI